MFKVGVIQIVILGCPVDTDKVAAEFYKLHRLETGEILLRHFMIFPVI